jgi:hypothetical protein
LGARHPAGVLFSGKVAARASRNRQEPRYESASGLVTRRAVRYAQRMREAGTTRRIGF